MHWSSVPETLAVGVIVLLFLSIYRRRQSTCTWYWIVGWIFIFIHFVGLTVMPTRPGLALDLVQFLTLSALTISGVLFFVATLELAEDIGTQIRFSLYIAAPLVTYNALLLYFPELVLLEAAIAAEFAVLCTIWYRKFYRPELFCGSLLGGSVLICGLSFHGALHGEFESPVIIGLTGLYCFTALSYWRRFRRPSAGVIMAVVGFLSWGSVFTFATLVEYFRPGLVPASSSIWNIPKYFVAGAMILTLLEEETISATRLMRRYQLQFDRSLCGVYRCSDDGRLLELNDAFATIFQLSREQISGANIAGLLEGSSGSGNAFMEQLAKQSHVMGMEFVITTASGAVRCLIGNASLVTDPLGGPAEIQGTILDITEFKNLQDQIRESQKLEALGRLAGGVAHDFNNLLMVISGHMELLEDSLSADPRSRAKVEAVKNATQRGAAITGQLLAFSRKRPTEPKLLDVNKMLSGALTLLLPVVGDGVTLEVKPGEGRFNVMADENQMFLVLLNMVINARDAMPKGGRVVLESASVDLDESLAKVQGLPAAGQYVCISVSDTGCGIPAEVKARVFEPFFTTKPQGKGTGLGLSICYGIIQQHHGTISIASTPGIGTTIHVYLPMVTERPSLMPEPQASSPKLKNARILVVDDEEMLRKPACAFFRQAGFQVTEASSSNEALEVFDADKFDLVITDMVMPGMNGRQLGVELRRRSPQLPIIYISGYAQDILESQGQLAASDILLQKPYSLKKLVQLAEKELEKHGTNAFEFGCD
jgi:PAS domain S-box-containing protein